MNVVQKSRNFRRFEDELGFGFEMSSFRVGGKVVEKVDLCRKKQLVWRLDVWPFAILYTVWLTTIVPSIDFTDACIALGALSAFHILVLLFTAWSVDFKCFVQFSKVTGQSPMAVNTDCFLIDES